MKRIVTFILVVMTMCLMAGCGSKGSDSTTKATPVPTDKAEVVTPEAATTSDEIPGDNTEVTGAPENNESTESIDEPKVTDIPSETDDSEITESPNENDDPEITESPDEIDIPTEAPEITDGPYPTVGPNGDAISDLYENFINDLQEVYIPEGTFDNQEQEYYYISELAEARRLYAEEYSTGTRTLIDAEYAYIDCGNDGIMELLLKLVYSAEDDYEDAFYDYIVMKAVGDKLEFCGQEHTYYRYDCFINPYGLVYTSGSNGATSHAYNLYVIDSDGYMNKVYESETNQAVSECIIDEFDLPSDIREEHEKKFRNDYGVYDEYEEYEYGYHRYNFVDAQDMDYDGYLRSSVFSFYSSEGVVMPSDEYLEWAEENGITIVSSDELDAMLEKRLEYFSITSEMQGREEPEWISISE